MTEEEWRPAVGWEGLYSVSSLGRVRSEDRVVETRSGVRSYKGRVLSPGLCGDTGYLKVHLSCVSGKKDALVAHLVLQAFVGPPPDGLQCCHNNGCRTDNRALNLRYDTPLNNCADKVIHGTVNHGERNGGAKLTVRDVLAVRADTRSQAAIAREYGVSQTCISRIKLRKKWAHV